MTKIKRTGQFDRMYKDLLKEIPELENEVDLRMTWFEKNPNDTRLDNHALHKSMKDKFAFSITDDIRIIYEWLGHNTVRFLAIGGHPVVYKQ